MTRIESTIEGYKNGFSYVPLNGKIPTETGWTKRPKESMEQAVKWATDGNVGIRCGKHSGGLIVIDADAGSDVASLELPTTVTVRTPNDGLHFYFKTQASIKNSASKLSPFVDIRATGGQVVAAGSEINGKKYEYIVSPEQSEITELPQWIVDTLTTDLPNYIMKAVDDECQLVRNAKKGTRNHTLNSAAFKLSRFRTEVSETYLTGRLLRATTLPRSEALRTIKNAITKQEPAPVQVKKLSQHILTPGVQQNKEIGTHKFTADVLEQIPDSVIFKRAGVAVDVFNQSTNIIRPDKMRTIIDSNLRLGKRMWTKKDGWHTVFVAATRDHANLVLSVIPESDIKDISMFSTFPIFTRSWELAKPGWHDGVYYDEHLKDIQPQLTSGLLDDILIDFPWLSDADKQNFIALMLTPLIRYAINGNAPMFLIKSSRPRTGKTKLAEEVIGGTYLGKQVPAMQMARDEAEQQKRIMAMLIQGDSIIHIDNVNTYLDSEAIATLITASEYRGRILGLTEQKTAPNFTTLIATANNPEATGEIVRRIVPITLQPKNDHPEMRDDFVHPNCLGYVLQNRKHILEHLIAMIQDWQQSGEPDGAIRLGGFENWARVVGGVMRHHGYKKFMTNWQEWKDGSDPTGNDLLTMVQLWWEKYKNLAVSSGELCDIAMANDLFDHIFAGRRTEQAKVVSFSMGVMRKNVDTPVGNYIIKRGPGRTYYLGVCNG